MVNVIHLLLLVLYNYCRYRCKVEKMDGGKVHVLYIDYGNVSINCMEKLNYMAQL